MDFRKVTNLFADPEFDGEPVQIYEIGDEDEVKLPELKPSFESVQEQVYLSEDYNIKTKCPGLTAREADSWLLVPEDSFSLAGGSKMELPEFVKFTIPETAPPCDLPYKIEIRTGSTLYISTTVMVTIQGKT